MTASSAGSLRDRLIETRVIPVLRLPDRDEAERAIDCLIDAGYRTVEVTLTMPGATELIGRLRSRLDAAFLVGAGTVLDVEAAQRCLDAGADYLVSPCLVAGMAATAKRAGRLALAGGFTPGEVLAAWRDGADIVKVFPAASGGPAHVAALHAVFPEVPLCPTGGVSADNLRDYFNAGACVVGIGNNVIDRKAMAAGNSAGVIRHAKRFLELAQEPA